MIESGGFEEDSAVAHSAAAGQGTVVSLDGLALLAGPKVRSNQAITPESQRLAALHRIPVLAAAHLVIERAGRDAKQLSRFLKSQDWRVIREGVRQLIAAQGTHASRGALLLVSSWPAHDHTQRVERGMEQQQIVQHKACSMPQWHTRRPSPCVDPHGYGLAGAVGSSLAQHDAQ